MAHTGTWQGRMRMARSIMGFGGFLCLLGALGGFTGAEASIMNNLIMTGGGMITATGAVVIGGKVWHDKGSNL